MQNTQSGNPAAENPHADRPEQRDWREECCEIRKEWRATHHRFPFHGLFCGLTLVLLGTLFLLDQTGRISGDTWWQSFLIGLGVILIIDGLAHYLNPAFRRGSYGKFVFGLILVLTGMIFLLGFSEWWPVILIAAGVAMLLRFFRR